jgi:hypothetical protein
MACKYETLINHKPSQTLCEVFHLPFGIGKVALADDSQVVGFICEPYGVEGAQDITHVGR